MKDLSEMMRSMLYLNGIQLDSPTPPRRATAPAVAPAAPIDRDEIRAILIERGAPEKDLEWLTRSCPSSEHARSYLPTIIEAVTPEDPDATPA